MEGLVFNIQRFSIHDGPGIRTTVFLKGCSLRCAWCHNPESISAAPEVQFYEQKCIGCGACVKVCPHAGASPAEIDRVLCEACGRCCEACPAQARTMAGKRYTPEACCEVALRDRDFYKTSGGGVTFSGGEPLLQADFVSQCCEILTEQQTNLAVDTAGNVPWSAFQKVLRFRPLFLYDLKHPDSEAHSAATGSGNERILENFHRLSESGCEIWVRIPLIPGYNDDDKWIAAYADIIKKAGVTHVNLMPLHRLGSSKYRSLGQEERCTALPPDDEAVGRVIDAFLDFGVHAARG